MSRAEATHQRSNYSSVQSPQTELITGQVVVMGPDDLIVSVARWLPTARHMITAGRYVRHVLLSTGTFFLSYLLSLRSRSSLSRPFGSRIITRPGVILNSLILDFSLPNKTPGQPRSNQVHCPLKSHLIKSQNILLNMVNYLPFAAKQSPARKEACISSHAHNRGASMV